LTPLCRQFRPLSQRSRTASFESKLLKNQVIPPDAIVTDGLKSYPAEMKVLGCIDRLSDSGNRTFIRTASRMISGEELK